METRGKILEVAFNALLVDGYDKLSLNEIIRRSGLTKGTFYHYFSSREELFKEVFERYFLGYSEQYAAHLEKTEGSAQEKLYTLSGIMEMLIKSMLPEGRDIDSQQFFNFLITASQKYPELREKQKESATKIKSFFENLITQGKEEGTIRISLPASELARLIYMSFRGTIFEWTLNPQGELKDSLMRTVKGITALLN